ncbi:PREDICTED: aldehyde dehydrogenase family 3 member B1-like [Nanorana parkeri]|uniref:aldehyde dehydrogenase family 3 member B1-like n=1 Tax=Nanorana parkeri TaxID=125878 RepID=UPI0008546D0D|nr:PREDICTED: aldehyde dehydrogenase family 3 member B1-like [Nanorana parkeri]
MDNANASPSPSRWFRVLRRLVTVAVETRKSSTSSLCEETLKKSREAFASGTTKTCSFRIQQLQAILEMLDRHEKEFITALEEDMHKPRFETVLSEITTVRNEAIYAINNLEKWMKPEPVQKNMASLLDSCYIQKEPVGVVLIIAGWSLPVQLCLIPMVGAVAAGNCVMVKPSETFFHTAHLLHTLLPNYMDNSCFQVLSGEHGDLLEILENKFDHIFFIGDRLTGRQVMQAAAKHITPVSMILGGKNPCYVDKSCDLNMTAHRIAWARFINAGQNSLAPEYVLCHPGLRDPLIQELELCVHEFYGRNPQESEHYGRIASVEHYKEVKDFLSCGKVAFGGQTDDRERYIAPTVLIDVKESDAIMQQEILGPVLPILTVQTLEEAIQFMQRKDRPLAVYVYSNSQKVIAEVMQKTSSGSFCSNDNMIQCLYTGLPCGGIGNSGVGIYGGKFSFDTFSHSRTCLLRNTAIECVTYLRYPPYAEKQLHLIQWASSLSRTNTWCNIL